MLVLLLTLFTSACTSLFESFDGRADFGKKFVVLRSHHDVSKPHRSFDVEFLVLQSDKQLFSKQNLHTKYDR